MTHDIDRRSLLKLGAGAGALAALGVPDEVLAQAAAKGQLTIAFPADVPTWDPNARSLAAVQSLYKCVFDQPITQNPDITPKPALVTKWGYVDDKGLALGLDLRSDVVFHDGSKMTAEDFRFSFFDRPRLPVPEGGRKLDTAFIWRRVKDIEVVSPTRVVDALHRADALGRRLDVLPDELRRAEGLHREGRPRRLPEEAGRLGPLQAGRVPAGRAHRAGGQ